MQLLEVKMSGVGADMIWENYSEKSKMPALNDNIFVFLTDAHIQIAVYFSPLFHTLQIWKQEKKTKNIIP